MEKRFENSAQIDNIMILPYYHSAGKKNVMVTNIYYLLSDYLANDSTAKQML